MMCSIAIKSMLLRGAPLIGVAAAYGIYLACYESRNAKTIDQFNTNVINKARKINSARPTAVNLETAVMNALKILVNKKSINSKTEAILKYANNYLSAKSNIAEK